MQSDTSDKVIAILIGIVIATVTVLLASMIAWGGEGWNGPLYCSLALPVLYPVVFLRLQDKYGRSASLNVVLAMVAIPMDVFLFWTGLSSENSYFTQIASVAMWLVLLWGILWLFWQFLVLVDALRRMDRRAYYEGDDLGHEADPE